MKLQYLIVLSFTLCLSIQNVYGQIGGKEVFTFLANSPSSRISALGGSAVGGNSYRLGDAYLNPASLSDTMHRALTFQHQFLFEGIQNGYAAYAHHLSKQNVTLHAAFNYLFYGDFSVRDEFGNLTGEANAKDLAIVVGGSYEPYEKLRVGINLKFISSQLDVYNSNGIAVDLGAQYETSPGGLTIGLALRNVGTQFSPYFENREDLPTDLQLGFSSRLKHLPFRFGVVFHHLNRWNLLYDNPTEESGFLFGNVDTNQPGAFDNFMRHVIINGEFILGKGGIFRLRFGYNHQLKQELSINGFRSLTGLSGGFGIRIKRFAFDYSLTKVHFGGSTHHLGLSTNLDYFTKNRIL